MHLQEGVKPALLKNHWWGRDRCARVKVAQMTSAVISAPQNIFITLDCSGAKEGYIGTLRSSACGRPGCWPGELGARERDRRSAGRAAGSEAIIMRACPAGRLARAIGKGERTTERSQNAARAHPAQAPRTQQDGSQNASDAWKLLKTIVIFERCGFTAKNV